MKAYNKCPDCNTRNEPIESIDKLNLSYYICICTECQNMYYQLSDTQDHIKSIDILLNQVTPVPYITKVNEVDNKEHEIKDKQTKL